VNQKVSLLGSTGSIGRQTLEVADALGLEVCALSAKSDIVLLERQIRKYGPAVAAVYDEGAARDLASRVRTRASRSSPARAGFSRPRPSATPARLSRPLSGPSVSSRRWPP
jgi:1-deoxy-D-xylulose-5-phosphate reductoisomerase